MITLRVLRGAVASSSASARSLTTPSSYLFDVDTALVPVETPNNTTTSTFRTAGGVSSNWSISNHPNGGYTMAMCISAAREMIPFRDTLTTTCHYLNPLLENEVAFFHSRVLKKSRTTATVEIACVQHNQERVRFTGTFGDLSTCREQAERFERRTIHIAALIECRHWKIVVTTLCGRGSGNSR
jgi:hypothetical protein